MEKPYYTLQWRLPHSDTKNKSQSQFQLNDSQHLWQGLITINDCGNKFISMWGCRLFIIVQLSTPWYLTSWTSLKILDWLLKNKQQQTCTPLMVSGTQVERVSSFSMSTNLWRPDLPLRLRLRRPDNWRITSDKCGNKSFEIYDDSKTFLYRGHRKHTDPVYYSVVCQQSHKRPHPTTTD